MDSSLDKKILFALDSDARQSIAGIAKQFGIHRNVAQYHVDKLQEQGVIQGTYAEINLLALGYRMYRLFFKLTNTTPQQEQELIAFLAQKPQTIWLFEVQGTWDVDVVFATKNQHETHAFIEETLSKFNALIQTHHLSELVENEKFPRTYLHTQTNRTPEKTLHAGKTHELDDTDTRILEMLATDARTQTVTIAQKVGLTAPAVAHRITKLQRNEIIRGFRAFIDTQAIGHTYYKIHIDLSHYEQRQLNAVKQYLRENPHIIYITKYIGGSTVECEAHLESQRKLQEFMQQLKERFGEHISDINILIFTKEHVFRHAPKDLF